MSLSATKSRLLTDFGRDLATCTADEIRARWSRVERAALDSVAYESGQPGFDATLAGHQPIYYLAQKVFFANDPSLLYAPLHRDVLCRAYLDWALSGKTDDAGLVILIQREAFKTTFTHGVFPMFLFLRGKHVENRDVRIALMHHKEAQASASLQKLNAKFVVDPWLRAFFPEFCSSEEFGTKLAFDTPCKARGLVSEPSVMAAGIGARLTGVHVDWLLWSDPVTEEWIGSKVIRDEGIQKYQASRFLMDSMSGKEVIDGTLYHRFDLHNNNLSAKAPSGKSLYRRVVVSAINDKDCLKEFLAGTIDEKRTDGLSFPTRHTYGFLRRRMNEIKAANGGHDALWWLQYQNEVSPESRIVLRADWFKKVPLKDVPPTGWRVVIVDPAWKGSTNFAEGDSASIQVWNMERRGAVIIRTLLDGVHSNNLSSKDGEEEIFRLMRRYGSIDVAPEERGGYVFSTNLINSAASHGTAINIIKLKSQTTSFDQRVMSLGREAESGRVFISEECDRALAFALLDQVENYQGPDSLPHDDAIDCAAYSCDTAIAESYAPRFARASLLPPWLREKPKDEASRTRYNGY